MRALACHFLGRQPTIQEEQALGEPGSRSGPTAVASGWKPQFEGAQVELAGEYLSNGRAVRLYIVGYGRQTQGAVQVRRGFVQAFEADQLFAEIEVGDVVALGDGQLVVFSSLATNLTSVADTNNTGDVFVRDVVAGTTSMASIRSERP